MQYLMAIDAGTGSIRAVIFDSNGRQVSASQREWTHIEEEGVPVSMTFDTEHNWGLVAACIRDALDQAELQGSDIAGVSATSMREGIVLYDESGEALWGVANVDARAVDEVKELKGQFPGIEEAFSYSKRDNTASATMKPEVRGNIAKERHRELTEIVKAKNFLFRREHDSNLEVLLESGREGIYSGFDQYFNRVEVESEEDLSANWVLLNQVEVGSESNKARL